MTAELLEAVLNLWGYAAALVVVGCVLWWLYYGPRG